MDNPTISIIIPVYNVEPYLPCCLESVLCQTFTDWECILVDDGSPDGSGAVCDKYATIDSRFRVFHKTNGGVSSARNLGLSHAKGVWVTFIDADDYVTPTYLIGLIAPVKENPDLDLIHGGCSDWKDGVVVGINQKYDKYVGDDKVRMLNDFRGLAVSKLYRTEHIRNWSIEGALQYDKNMTIAEDMAFTLDYMRLVKKYAFVPETGYYYRRDNENSATRNKKKKDYNKELIAWKHISKSLFVVIKQHNIKSNDIQNRMMVSANMMIATMYTLRQADISINDKIKRLRSDFSQEEIEMLSFATASGLRKCFVRNMQKHKYTAAYLAMAVTLYADYFSAALAKLNTR